MKVSLLITFIAMAAALSGCVTATTGPRQPTDEEAAVANLNLGIGYLRQGRPDAAVEALERAADLDPRSADAHSALALAYDQLREPEQAEDHHRRATQLDVGNAAAQNSYAVFLCRQNRWAEAERFFRRAAENPRYATPAAALTNAGNCARDSNDVEKAEQNYRAALAINPAFADALNGMIELSVQNENYLQARAFIQRLFTASTPTARQLWLCVFVERQLGDVAAAENCAQQLRTNFPNSSELAALRELERNAGP
jgi:type IV pilus assembly protein PilF